MERKTKVINDQIEGFYIKGEVNPCGCGGNVFYQQDDGLKTYGVCTACKRDIYEYKERETLGEWR